MKIAGGSDTRMDANASEDNFTCGKWNLTTEEHAFQQQHGYWIQSVASIIVSIFGSILNVVTIVVLSNVELKRLFFNKLLICLTVFDILFLLNSIYESFRLHITGTDYCSFQGHVLFVLFPMRKIVLCCSIYMTLVLTFERYLAVARPIAHRNRSIGSSEGKRVLKYVSPVIFFSIIYCMPTFFSFMIQSGDISPTHPWHPMFMHPDYNSSLIYNSETKETEVNDERFQNITITCIIATKLRESQSFILWYKNVANFVVTGAIPFLSLACLNCKIYHIIQASSKEQANLTVCSRQLTSSNGQNAQKSQKSEELRQAIVLFGIVIAFFVCHVLRIILSIEEIITYKDWKETEKKAEKAGKLCGGVQFWAMVTTDWSHLLLQINGSINFFIYCFFGKQFKKVLKEQLLRLAKKLGLAKTRWGSEESFGSRRTSMCRLNLTSTRSENVLTNNFRSHFRSNTQSFGNELNVPLNETSFNGRNRTTRTDTMELQSLESLS